MIQPQELRLGNYVYDRGGKVIRIDFLEHVEKGYDCKFGQNGEPLSDGSPAYALTEYTDYAKPIPLTEEWLVKLGMLKYTDSIPYAYVFNLDKKLGFNRFRLQWARYGDGVEGFYNLHLYKIQCTRIQYVHQFQNLYFALTGVELEVKP